MRLIYQYVSVRILTLCLPQLVSTVVFEWECDATIVWFKDSGEEQASPCYLCLGNFMCSLSPSPFPTQDTALLDLVSVTLVFLPFYLCMPLEDTAQSLRIPCYSWCK